MLDLKFIRENIATVRANCEARNARVDLDRFMALDGERLGSIALLDDIRRRQNETAEAMKEKLDAKSREALVAEGRELKAKAASAQGRLDAVQAELDAICRQIPNMTHPDAPIAAGEAGNREIRRFGEPKRFPFSPKGHVELGEALDLMDFDAGAKVAGQKFYYLKNEAVLLDQALVCYALHILRREGFKPIATPDLARASILEGIGFNPRGAETQVYSVADSDLCLIATAEITLGGMLADTILDEAELPIKLAGLSHCFRTEAGAAGRESKGLYRVHQFTKVEMFAFCAPEASEGMHEEFVRLEESIFQGLSIPYRVVDICTGDLGAPAWRKYDLEAWMPGRGDGGGWGEVTSTSNCTDYQARRLGIRFKRQGAKRPLFVHMLNGTAVATSRALIAIIENFQEADGSISVPPALLPYMDGVERIARRGASDNRPSASLPASSRSSRTY